MRDLWITGKCVQCGAVLAGAVGTLDYGNLEETRADALEWLDSGLIVTMYPSAPVREDMIIDGCDCKDS